MPESTNQLVAKLKRFALPVSLAAVAVLGSAIFFHKNCVHAATVESPLDDNSVAALTAIDHAMEAVAYAGSAAAGTATRYR
jgi:serine protease Do